MIYPVNIVKDGDGFLATFPDIPEAITSGDTYDEAYENAKGALIDAFSFYFEDHRTVPEPSDPKGAPAVDVPASVWSKVLVLNAMIEDGVTPSELARRMKTKPQTVNRIVNLDHTSKIDTLYEALKVLNRKMKVTLV